MDYSVLDCLGIGWHDSVCEANDKRSETYDKHQESANEFARNYTQQWENRVPAASPRSVTDWVMTNRLQYRKSFDVENEVSTLLVASVPIDGSLRDEFVELREDVLSTLLKSVGIDADSAKDMTTSPVWIPDIAHIPREDLHITLCNPGDWRVPEGDDQARLAYNEAVAETMAAVTSEFEPFVVEVDRVILNQDGALLVLFRTVGTQDVPVATPSHRIHYPEQQHVQPMMLYDRSSSCPDPMSSLRSEILYAFLHKKLAHCQRCASDEASEQVSNQPTRAFTWSDRPSGSHAARLLRKSTIVRTVGGSVTGYIHCSLSRLALAPSLTLTPVNMDELLRVTRAWSSKLAGRRMLVRGYKLTESTSAGGNKNPFPAVAWQQDIVLGGVRPIDADTESVRSEPVKRPTSCADCWPRLLSLRRGSRTR